MNVCLCFYLTISVLFTFVLLMAPSNKIQEVLCMIYGLGDKLKALRQQFNLSQKEVASIIDTSPSIISNYESGERTPSVENLIALARLYQCSTDYLLGFQSNDTDATLNVSMLTFEQKVLLQQFLASFQ